MAEWVTEENDLGYRSPLNVVIPQVTRSLDVGGGVTLSVLTGPGTYSGPGTVEVAFTRGDEPALDVDFPDEMDDGQTYRFVDAAVLDAWLAGRSLPPLVGV